MQTVTVDIINQKAYKLLQDLEGLQLIRLRKEVSPAGSSAIQSLKGRLGKQSSEDTDQQLDELRNSWE